MMDYSALQNSVTLNIYIELRCWNVIFSLYLLEKFGPWTHLRNCESLFKPVIKYSHVKWRHKGMIFNNVTLDCHPKKFFPIWDQILGDWERITSGNGGQSWKQGRGVAAGLLCAFYIQLYIFWCSMEHICWLNSFHSLRVQSLKWALKHHSAVRYVIDTEGPF